MVDHLAGAERPMSSKSHAVLPGDLRTPTVRMSYAPGYELCVIVSDVTVTDYGTSIPRLFSVIVDPPRKLTMPYNVRAGHASSPENLMARGDRT